jgi:hypothetical protein
MSITSVERLSGFRHSLSLAFAALVAGSRAIPLGDNGSLLHDLALRSARTGAPLQGARPAAQPRTPGV